MGAGVAQVGGLIGIHFDQALNDKLALTMLL